MNTNTQEFYAAGDFSSKTKRILQKLVVQSWNAEATANLCSSGLPVNRALSVLTKLVQANGYYSGRTWSHTVAVLVSVIPVSAMEGETLDALNDTDPDWLAKVNKHAQN
jgi:hypothetical protein